MLSMVSANLKIYFNMGLNNDQKSDIHPKSWGSHPIAGRKKSLRSTFCLDISKLARYSHLTLLNWTQTNAKRNDLSDSTSSIDTNIPQHTTQRNTNDLNDKINLFNDSTNQPTNE